MNNDRLGIYLTLKQPTCIPASTRFDHEEWARFYLELLTDSEYQRFGRLYYDLRPWNDTTLINKARQHVEAAKLLKALDELHTDDNEEDE